MKTQIDYFAYIFNILVLIVGWLLGILSNIIIEKRGAKKIKTETTKGILVEIDELKDFCLSVNLVCARELGKYDRSLFEWLKPSLFKFLEKTKYDFQDNLEELLKNFEKLDDHEQYEILKQLYINPHKNLTDSFNFQKFSTPFIDVRTNNISNFDEEIQRLMFIIKRDLYYINGEFDRIWFYNSKTFDGVSVQNHERLNKNIYFIYNHLFNRTKKMVDTISKVQSKLGFV